MITAFEHARDHLAEAIRQVRPIHMALLGIAALILLAVAAGDGAIEIGFLGVVLGLALIWVREFSILMRAAEEEFPGRFDKPIWALAILLVPPVGVVAFWVFRRAHWAEAKPHPRSGRNELF